MIKVGDVVSAGGPDAYTVESISGDGMAMCYENDKELVKV